jgi:hypothetical protein
MAAGGKGGAGRRLGAWAPPKIYETPLRSNASSMVVKGTCAISFARATASAVSAEKTHTHWLRAGTYVLRTYRTTWPSADITAGPLGQGATQDAQLGGCQARQVAVDREHRHDAASQPGTLCSSGHERSARGEDPAIRQQRPGVVEQDDPVAEQAPALLRMCDHDGGGIPVGGIRGWAHRLVSTHGDLRTTS